MMLLEPQARTPDAMSVVLPSRCVGRKSVMAPEHGCFCKEKQC